MVLATDNVTMWHSILGAAARAMITMWSARSAAQVNTENGKIQAMDSWCIKTRVLCVTGAKIVLTIPISPRRGVDLAKPATAKLSKKEQIAVKSLCDSIEMVLAPRVLIGTTRIWEDYA